MTSERSKRADAAANRERLLASAGELIAARGIEVPLHDVARAAGVGPATLYRNFDGRHELLMALADAMDERFVALLRTVAETEGGWNAIETFVVESWQMYVDMPWAGAVRAYSVAFRQPPPEWEEALHSIVRRAWDEGSLRRDIEWTDVIFIPTLFVGFLGYPEPVRTVIVERQRRLVFDALRPDAARPSPGEPELGIDRFRTLVDLPRGD